MQQTNGPMISFPLQSTNNRKPNIPEEQMTRIYANILRSTELWSLIKAVSNSFSRANT